MLKMRPFINPSFLCFQGSSYSGFLWESSSGIDLKDAAVLGTSVGNGNGTHALPFLAHFLVSIPAAAGFVGLSACVVVVCEDGQPG